MTISTDLDVPAEPAGPLRRSRLADKPQWTYGRTFWFAYLANLTFMVAITLLYRYADFVTHLGGNELDLGLIVGVGMTGSLAMRLAQAGSIDRYGAGRIWFWSLVLMIASLIGHLLVKRIDTPLVYVLRIALSTSIAGTAGASITYVSRSMPVARMAEVIGLLGTSGFLAMMVGPAIGDVLCGGHDVSRERLHVLFLLAAALAFCSLVCSTFATRGEQRPIPRRRPPLVWLLSRYHPGPILAMGVVVGVGASLPAVFLPTFAEHLGIGHIANFFVVYACTAFVTRVLTRHFPHRFGVKPLIYWGMFAQVASMLCYLVVSSAWQFAIPGFFGGIAHALLFPAVVASGCGEFPNRYHGLGTILMLAMVDVGSIVGAPVAGLILHYGEAFHLQPYPAMFVTVATALALVGVYYAIFNRESCRQPSRRRSVIALD